jgi:hypothetical protein
MIKYNELFYNISTPVDALNFTGAKPEGPNYTWTDVCKEFNFTNIDCDDEESIDYDEDECDNIANGEIPWPGP